MTGHRAPLLVLLLLLGIVCGTAFAAVEEPAVDYVRRQGDGFAYRGESYRFVGVNARTLLWNEAAWTDREAYLDAADAMGVKVIRIYVAHREKGWQVDDLIEEASSRLETLFDLVREKGYDLKFTLCLTDNIRDLNHDLIVPGDETFYEERHGRLHLNRKWFDGGYKSHYMKFVDGLQRRFFNEPAIFAWELGNELQVPNASNDVGPSNRKLLLDFIYDVGRQLKQGTVSTPAVRQMLTTGFISVRHAISAEGGPPFNNTIQDIYVGRCIGWFCTVSPIDFITIHTYNNRHAVLDGYGHCDLANPAHCPDLANGERYDLDWNANAPGPRPVVVGEGGFNADGTLFPGGWWHWGATSSRICGAPASSNGRAPATRRTVATFFDVTGADGYMQWAFWPDFYPLTVDAQSMDTTPHLDFDRLRKVYLSQAVRLERGESLPAQYPFFAEGVDCIEVVAEPTELVMEGSPGTPSYENVVLSSLSDVTTGYQAIENVSWLSVSPATGVLSAEQNLPLQLIGECPATPGTYETTVELKLNHPWNDQIAVEKLFVRLECPGVELCDGLDNDSDGEIDEGNVCQCSTVVWGGSAYRFCDASVSWTAARDACSAQGYHLAKVENQAENDFIADTSEPLNRWLGLNDLDVEGEWRWLDGAPVLYENWGVHEPNGNDDENCGQGWFFEGAPGAWNDLNCTWDVPFVCEQ